jgi:hypothetical protein
MDNLRTIQKFEASAKLNNIILRLLTVCSCSRPVDALELISDINTRITRLERKIATKRIKRTVNLDDTDVLALFLPET